MKEMMKTGSRKKFVAVVMAAILIVSLFTAATDKKAAIVTVSYDGTVYSYATYASTVEEFLDSEGILVKENDYMNQRRQAPIKDGMDIIVNLAKYVTVHDDGFTYGSITYETTVSEVMEDFSAPLDVADGCFPERDERVYDGIELYVTRANCVTFSKSGSTLEYYTHSETVGEFLEEMGVTVGADEKVVPDVDTAITDGMTVSVKNKVEAMSVMDFGLDLSQATRVFTCEATAYTSAADECGKSDGITASGMMFRVGVVAVDPKVIPLGTKLYIESVDGKYVYGYCIAADTGGSIKKNRVDLAMNTKSECFQFGRRNVRVYVFD